MFEELTPRMNNLMNQVAPSAVGNLRLYITDDNAVDW